MENKEIDETIKKVLLEMGNPIEKINSTSLNHITYSYDMVVRFIQSLPSKEVVESTDEDIDVQIESLNQKYPYGEYILTRKQLAKTIAEWMRSKVSPTPSVSIGDVEIKNKKFGAYSYNDLVNLLEDVVNELDLSEIAIEKHGPLGTVPSKLVKLVLEEKDLKISALKSGLKDISTPSKISIGEIEKKAEEYVDYFIKNNGMQTSETTGLMLFTDLEKMLTDFAKSILASDAVETVTCECGNKEPLSNARFDDDGLHTCDKCYISFLEEYLIGVKKKEAVEFAEWIKKEGYIKSLSFETAWHKTDDCIHYGTSELYSLFSSNKEGGK